MKKKKRKKRTKHRKKGNQNNYSNRHHIFYQGRYWEKNRWSNALRNHQFCIAELPIEKHNAIHAELSNVPIPSPLFCEGAVRELNYLWNSGAIGPDTPIQIRLNVLICLLDYVAEDTSDALMKQKEILYKFDKPH